MRHIILFFMIFLISCVDAFAMDTTTLFKLRSAVIEMCRGGTIQGKTSKINATASATGTVVVIKNLLEGGGDAKAEITNEQWNGIQALINPTDYTKCVESSLNILVPALDKSSK
jgi:hypothetical protein